MHGTHRVKTPESVEDAVWVTDGTMGFEVTESEYQAKGYRPEIETLPWGKSLPGGDDA